MPGVRSDGTDPFPVITSQEYVEIARGMRQVLMDESPKITHKQQMIEFGEPAPQFWDDLIAEHKVLSSLPSIVSECGCVPFLIHFALHSHFCSVLVSKDKDVLICVCVCQKAPAAGKTSVGLQQKQHAQSLPFLRPGIESLPGLKADSGMDSWRKAMLILWLVGMSVGGLMLKRRMGRSKAS